MTPPTEKPFEPTKPLNQRLFDLVRYCRAELHQQDLITDDEYTLLLAGPDGKCSVSNLESYDQIRAQLSMANSISSEATAHRDELRDWINSFAGQFEAQADQGNLADLRGVIEGGVRDFRAQLANKQEDANIATDALRSIIRRASTLLQATHLAQEALAQINDAAMNPK